jgi:superfamily II DNA/RNA helicase
VFNFDVPIHADDYVHRVGRTGRAGRSGAAYMLASHRDGKYIEAIEKVTGQKLARREMMDIEVREESRPHRGHDRHGRGGKGGHERGGKDRHRDRRPPGGKFHDQVASMEPTEVSAAQAEAPVAVSVPEQRPDKPKHDKPRHRPQNQPNREKRGSQRQHNEQAARTEAVNRSELPAFLFRPVPVKKPEPQQ